MLSSAPVTGLSLRCAITIMSRVWAIVGLPSVSVPNDKPTWRFAFNWPGRIQSVIEEPISVDGLSLYVSACVGFCLSSRAPGSSGAAWSQAAATALRAAQKRGPSAIRAYTDEMRRITQSRAELREEVTSALESGQIIPWFQPQISTDTGKVTGFEALARWNHPERGMIAPAEFLPAIESIRPHGTAGRIDDVPSRLRLSKHGMPQVCMFRKSA